MNRQQRRAARHKHAQRHQHDSDSNLLRNPVAQALVRVRVMSEVQRLRTNAALHAYTGHSAANLTDQMGRLLFTVAHAAGLHGLGTTPEANVLRGCANALADVAATPACLEQQRAAILSGLGAIERLLPHLHEYSLAAGALELDLLLARGDMGTASVERALHGPQ